MATFCCNIGGLRQFNHSQVLSQQLLKHMSQSITAQRLEINTVQTMQFDEVANRVMRGEVIIIPQCLQGIGYFKQLQSASLAGIRQVVGAQRTEQIQQQGFEKIHHEVSLDELIEIIDSTYLLQKSLAPSIAKALAQQIFQVQQPFYYEECPNVRFHIPYDATLKKRQQLSQFRWNGKVTAHGPHHDSWYHCPVNSLNVWIAVSSVKVGNGLTLYPQVYGDRLPCDEKGKILKNQYFGKSLEFNLEPGDVLMFHGEHLHGSELNSTDETRHVVSFRMVLDSPRFLEKSPYQYNYIRLEVEDGIAPRLRQRCGDLLRLMAKQLDSWINRSSDRRYIISASKHSFNNTSSRFPARLEAKFDQAETGKTLFFQASDLKIGEIKPLTAELCIARRSGQQVTIFNRFCPHEGADLAGGSLQGDCIICPWHNLRFNLDSGESACQSLPRLSTDQYVAQGSRGAWLSNSRDCGGS